MADVAKAALDALNLDWSQVGQILKWPTNKPIPIRVVTAPVAGSVSVLWSPPKEEYPDTVVPSTSTSSVQTSRQIKVLSPAVLPTSVILGATKVATFSISATNGHKLPSASQTVGVTEAEEFTCSSIAHQLPPVVPQRKKNVTLLDHNFVRPKTAAQTKRAVRRNRPTNSKFYGLDGEKKRNSVNLNEYVSRVNGITACRTYNIPPPSGPAGTPTSPTDVKRESGEQLIELPNHGRNGLSPPKFWQPDRYECGAPLWKKILYTNEKIVVDRYPYKNARNGFSCARVRPYLAKSQRPPRAKETSRISAKKTKATEALEHFDMCVEKVAKDSDPRFCDTGTPLQEESFSVISREPVLENKRPAAENSSEENPKIDNCKYRSGFGVRPHPRPEKIQLSSLNMTSMEKPKLTKFGNLKVAGTGKPKLKKWETAKKNTLSGTKKPKTVETKKKKREKPLCGATCARVRPIAATFVCARCRPYNGLRKEFHWYYFMMHPERKVCYVPKGHKVPLSDPLCGKSRNITVSVDLPLPLQYRFYLQRAVKIFLGKSPIHGIGVFADEDVESGRLVLEYRGQIIRNSLVDRREQRYKKKELGSYMFVLNSNFTVDATLHGSVARFINHSCQPNCAAKIIAYEGTKKIVLYTISDVEKGEELCYDYKMPLEQEKIPCLCKRPTCRKFLN